MSRFEVLCFGITCILLIVPGCQSLENLPLEEWTTSDYPHNLQNPEWCGREDKNQAIYVCDPNNLLEENEGMFSYYVFCTFGDTGS